MLQRTPLSVIQQPLKQALDLGLGNWTETQHGEQRKSTRRRPAQHGKLGVGGFLLDGLDPRGVEIARFDKKVRIRGQRRQHRLRHRILLGNDLPRGRDLGSEFGLPDAAPSLLRKSLVKSLK